MARTIRNPTERRITENQTNETEKQNKKKKPKPKITSNLNRV